MTCGSHPVGSIGKGSGTMNCACVFVDSDSDVVVQCGRTVIATCSECGTAIWDDWLCAML